MTFTARPPREVSLYLDFMSAPVSRMVPSSSATSRRAAAAPEQNPGAGNVAAILQAMTANQSAKQSLNAARRSLDDDLFAA